LCDRTKTDSNLFRYWASNDFTIVYKPLTSISDGCFIHTSDCHLCFTRAL